MKPDAIDIVGDVLVSTAGAVVFTLLSWAYFRSIRRGRELTPFMRGLLRYGLFAALGMGYIFTVGSAFGWPKSLWFAGVFLWFALLGTFAYWRRDRGTTGKASEIREETRT